MLKDTREFWGVTGFLPDYRFLTTKFLNRGCTRRFGGDNSTREDLAESLIPSTHLVKVISYLSPLAKVRYATVAEVGFVILDSIKYEKMQGLRTEWSTMKHRS